MLSRRVGGCVALCGLLAGRVASLCPHPGESALLPPCAEHLKSTKYGDGTLKAGAFRLGRKWCRLKGLCCFGSINSLNTDRESRSGNAK